MTSFMNGPQEKGGRAKDWRKGKPVRVVRSEKFKKHSKFAPEEGCRYDGTYKGSTTYDVPNICPFFQIHLN